MGESENYDVAWFVAWMHVEKQTFAPILMMHDRVWKRFRNLMSEVLV